MDLYEVAAIKVIARKLAESPVYSKDLVICEEFGEFVIFRKEDVARISWRLMRYAEAISKMVDVS